MFDLRAVVLFSTGSLGAMSAFYAAFSFPIGSPAAQLLYVPQTSSDFEVTRPVLALVSKKKTTEKGKGKTWNENELNTTVMVCEVCGS